MGINFSKFSQEIQDKIKAALEDTKSPDKIDAAELRAMNLEKDVANKLMQELCGNRDYLGDGYIKMQNKNKILILLDKPVDNAFIPLTQDSLNYYHTHYGKEEIAQGIFKDGMIYLADSKGRLVKDRFGNFICEKVSVQEYKEETDSVEGSFEIIENEPAERTNRRFAIALIRSMYMEVINELQTIVSQMGVLDAGLWREALGMGVQALADLKENQQAITATTKKKIERIEAERDNICNSLNDLLDSPDEFEEKFHRLVGKDYRNNAFEELRDIQHNQEDKASKIKFKECAARFKELYPDNKISENIEVWEDSIDYQQTVDQIANIIVMFVMTGGIGKIFQGSVQIMAKEILLAAAKGNKKAVMANFAKLAPEVQTVWKSMANREFGVLAAQTVTPMAQSAATMGTWEGLKAFLNNLTNAEQMSPEELLKRTVEGFLGGVEMGVVMGGLETFAIAPAMVKLAPVLNKLSGASAEISGLIEKGNGVVSMEKVMGVYTKASETLRGKIVKEGAHTLVALPTFTVGFTVTDTAFHYDEAEFRKQLLEAATTDEEREAIKKMNSVDLRLEFAKKDFEGQVKGMMTIEGVGLMFRRLQAGRLAAQSMNQKQKDILGANLCPVKENGKTVYEICTKEGEVIPVKNRDKTITRFSSIEQATAAYTVLCASVYSELSALFEEANKPPKAADKKVQYTEQKTNIEQGRDVSKNEMSPESEELTFVDEDRVEIYHSANGKDLVLVDGRFNNQPDDYITIGNKIFEIRPKDVTENPEKIAELRAEIEQLRKTEPENAQELDIILQMFTNPPSVQDVTDSQIDAVVNYLNTHYDIIENYLTKQADGIGISDKNIGRFGHRIKGEWSTRDKVANYVKNSKEKNEPKTLLDAYKDVRDKYASRTVFKKGDYSNHPEIVKILEEGNYSDEAYRKAVLRAAELQSEPAVKMLIEAMRRAKEEGIDLSMLRISNYYSEDGIPIFSPGQIKKFKLECATMGIDVEFVRLAKEIDPRAKTEFVDGAVNKKQPSGYTALQINFVTKTGEIIEWQYRGELVNIFAEAEHLPYDIRTGKHPWRQYPILEDLYKPIAALLSEKTMPKHAYKQLNKYFTDYYTYLRKLELGFESKEPKLEDYEHYKAKDENGVEREYTFKFDKRLEAKNLIKLHEIADKVKDKDNPMTKEQGIKEYEEFLKTGAKSGSVSEQNQSTQAVLDIFNSKEGLKDIKDDIKTQIAGLIGNSAPENRDEMVKLIYGLKNAKERWGAKTQEYSDEQLLQIISTASNPDGTLNLTVIQRLCKRMDGGPREDNSNMTRILPMDTKEHNLARRSDGFYDEDLVEIGRKLTYAHETREEIFALLKDENGNPIKDLIELINTDKNEDFDDGEMLLEALHALYTDGKLDLNKVNQMKELVNGGLTIYGAAGAMESGMPAGIVKNMPVFAQKGLSRPDVNSVVEYLKNKNIEPTLEAVNDLIENCGDIPEFREIHIKHLLNLRGETIDKSAYNNVRYLSERINEYYNRHPELAGKKPDLVSQYMKLLYVEGRTTQLTQREIMDLIGDMANNGTQRYNIDKLVDSGVLRDIPGRRKPLSKNDLLILQKEDFDVLKKAVEKGLLSDEYMNLCSLSEIKHALVTGGKSKLTRLTELSDTELKNLAYMDWSDLDFTTAISLAKCNPKKVDFVLDVMNIYTVPDYQKILLRDYNIDLAYKLFKEIDPHTTFPDSDVSARVNDIIGILYVAKPHNINEINYMYDNRTELGITTSQIKNLVSNEIKARDIRNLAKKIGKANISRIDERALPVAIKFADFYKVKDINELSAVQKRKLRIKLTECNSNLFDPAVQQLKELFPLIPKNQEEYCTLMPEIVNSLGIQTKPLTEGQIKQFEASSLELGQALSRLSDSDFANLTVTQEYSREDFIRTVMEKVKGLPKSEKLKVYDYFGFELHSNETNETGYTLTGYPVNIHNGEKLAKIKSEETRQAIESLRSDVIRFSEHNKIKCNDPLVEQLLNQVMESLPELRTMIGRGQHGTHDYDVMQHTLKVLQKIVQDKQFETLSDSDKKVVTLAALMHDITKSEGKTDSTHASQGSFDGFFISHKFNLTREEGIKMFTLMNMHEWLNFVNKPISDYELNNALKEYNKEHSKSEQITALTPEITEQLRQEILTKRLQSVAFDLQQDNLFELALMFTHADLKAVKKDNYFHDSAEIPTCATFNGKTRVLGSGQGRRVSHGEAADIYAERIREYVNELKNTRPLTPVTRVPDSEAIRSRITQINPDGSTNFKGVFVDKDGLIVIKFNDVEDWEALGFPKGTTTKGIKGTGKIKKEGGIIEESEFETGNFKFFAHALNYANQLIKFDSFSLPDSNVLLSVTYMERPESKYRNFNTQGIGLYVQSKYVHGGGNTDAGSGTGKSISEFKKNYIFGGKREKDRTFTADIIKKATGMSDEQYVQFYEKNKNKTWEEVEPIDGSNPVEFRDRLIKAVAENIVSNERGDRAYDEYYVTNPEEPMFAWVYASDKNEKIGQNPLEFLHRNNKTDKENKIGMIGHTAIRPVEERTRFLREYCLNRNKVMFVFGD